MPGMLEVQRGDLVAGAEPVRGRGGGVDREAGVGHAGPCGPWGGLGLLEMGALKAVDRGGP